jgi:hypothetical protein
LVGHSGECSEDLQNFVPPMSKTLTSTCS